MRISSDSARRRNRDRSSLTSASAAWRTRRPVLGEPAGRFGLRDDREDLDGFTRDVIKHLHFPHPEPILRSAQAPQALDPALAYPGGFVPQVSAEGVSHFGPAASWHCPVGPSRLASEDDPAPHSGHSRIAPQPDSPASQSFYQA